MRSWLHFGPYRLDLVNRALFRGQERVSLAPKAIEILGVLARAAGDIVSKEMLLDEVWSGTFVEESSLTKNISELRSALGYHDGDGRYIETFPRRGYRLMVPVERISLEPSVRRRKGLAVLPFRAIGDGCDSSAGLRVADALITRLATSPEFEVRATREIAQAHGGSRGGESFRDLDVDFVLDGSLQECDKTIRVTVQLIDGRNGRVVWGESFDREFRNWLSVENWLAEELGGALGLVVRGACHELVSSRYTDNSEAYQLYLRGRYHWSRRSDQELRAGIACFRKAIAADPEYAPAYSGLAACYAMLPMQTFAPARRFMPKARAAAIKALDLDGTLAEAHTTIAFVKWHYDFDWRWAEREFRIALEFQPEEALTHQWLSLLLVEMGRVEEGIAEAHRAQLLAPNSAGIRANVAALLYLAGRIERSAAVARESLDLDRDSLRARWILGLALEQLHRLDEAIATFEEACRKSHQAPYIVGSLGHAYALAGLTDEAVAELQNLRHRRPRHCFLEEALITLALGDAPSTLHLLQRACRERQFHVVILGVDARLAKLHSLPEFKSLLHQIGLGSLA